MALTNKKIIYHLVLILACLILSIYAMSGRLEEPTLRTLGTILFIASIVYAVTFYWGLHY
jgi:hypothetical protein